MVKTLVIALLGRLLRDNRGYELVAVAVRVRLAKTHTQIGVADFVVTIRFGKVLALDGWIRDGQNVVDALVLECRPDTSTWIAKGCALGLHADSQRLRLNQKQ